MQCFQNELTLKTTRAETKFPIEKRMIDVENDRLKKQIDTLLKHESDIKGKLHEMESIVELITASEDLTHDFKDRYKTFCLKFAHEVHGHLKFSEDCIEYLRSRQNSHN